MAASCAGAVAWVACAGGGVAVLAAAGPKGGGSGLGGGEHGEVVEEGQRGTAERVAVVVVVRTGAGCMQRGASFGRPWAAAVCCLMEGHWSQ